MEEATKVYIDWLKAKNVEISSKITIADLTDQNQGRGIVAIDDIETDEVLFKIPQTSILNVETSSLVQDFPDFKVALFGLSQWEGLILVFAYELFVKGKSSEWNDYFNVLPINVDDNTFHQLIYWNEDELNHLKPSLVLQRIGKQEAKEMYTYLQDIIKDHNLGIDLRFNDFQKIATIIMSYSFDVEILKNDDDHDDDDENEDKAVDLDMEGNELTGYHKSMVPLADTLNADTEFQNANLCYTDGSLVMMSTKRIKKNEQIYNTYSDHPNSEILRRYGYVQEHGSKFDFAEIPLDLVKDYFSKQYKISTERMNSFIDSISKIVDQQNSANEFEDEISLILDSYDVFISKEVQTEFIFLVQLLTVIVAMDSTINSADNEMSTLKRIYKKCYQLVESDKLTNKFKENYENIIQARIDQYQYLIEPRSIRESMAKVVLDSELSSLKACKNISEVFNNFKFIDDQKLTRNIDKKRSNQDDSKQSSKKTRI